MSHWVHAGMRGRERVSAEHLGFSADPTRIFRIPEDQVVKRGTTVQLECRVKHDPSLKLTVSWLKDDQPLYIGNRSPLRPSPFLVLVRGPFLSLLGALQNPGVGSLCPACPRGAAELGRMASGETPTLHPLPLSHQLSASLSFSSLPNSFLSSLFSPRSFSFPLPLL